MYVVCVNTPWSRVLLEKLTGSQLVKKFPSFYETRRFITALTSARQLSLSLASSIQSITPHPTSWRSILFTSIYQPTNAHIISHKTLLKPFKTLRHVSILSDHHQGALLFLAKVILKYNFSKEQSSLMMICQDRNMSECFKVFYMKLYVHSLVHKLKWFYKKCTVLQ